MRIAILYTELADYTIACLKALKNTDPAIHLLVIHYPVNPEAPFAFDFGGIGEFICNKEFPTYEAMLARVEAFQPDKILCCGWVNKWYVKICHQYRRKAINILTLDNHWRGTMKQQLLRIVSRVYLKKIYKKVWVPGAPQTQYAKKIGYDTNSIMTGFYCCDLERYDSLYHKFRLEKERAFPHRLLSVARYIPSKNYQTLWKAFIQWKEQSNTDWELWCAGTGEQFEDRVQHPAIRHLGFVQKNQWEEVVGQTGIFILPSLDEPWAVAVHEFAVAGYPLLLSNRVGAASRFLSTANGLRFDPANADSIIQCFDAISRLTQEQLVQMSMASHALGQTITPRTWAETLLKA